MSLRTRHLLDAVEYVANGQLGLITAAQLSEIGIPSSSLSNRIRTGGPWRRLVPSIYCVADGPITVEQREMAGLLFAGPGAELTGLASMRRMGIKYLPGDPLERPVHVLIPIERHRKSAGFVSVERSQRLPHPQIIDGVPCAPLARAIVDAARRLTSRRDVRAFTLEAVQRQLVEIPEVAAELALAQRRGTALIRDCIQEARAGVRSVPEAELRYLVGQTSLPPCLWNPKLYLPSGQFFAQPDGLIPESMTVLEVDSEEFHSEGDGWTNTLDRATRYAAHGIVAVHIVPRNMRSNPSQTLRSIRESHEYALTRPRPNLLVVPIDTDAK